MKTTLTSRDDSPPVSHCPKYGLLPGLLASLLALLAWTPVLPAQIADEHRAFPIDRVRGAVMHELALKSRAGVKSQATVETDRPDYPPGTQVNVTGSGWLPGEVVELTITETQNISVDGTLDGPFVFRATADAQGNIANGDFSTDQRDLGVTFVLTALGQSSARTAQTSFTDSSYTSFFQLDGNTLTSGGTGLHDWDQVYSDFKKTTVNASGTGAINFYNDVVPVAVPGAVNVPAQEDTLSGGNSKDTADISAWTYNANAPQNKANLENAIGASYLDPGNGNHTYLYVGATRYDNSGSIALGVWFLQNPIAEAGGKFYRANSDGSPNLSVPETHVNGDLLLVANFTSGNATITSLIWSNGLPASGTTLSTAIGTAVVNTLPLDGVGSDPAPVPWPYRSSGSGSAANYVQPGEFFEAGVDLNLLFPTHVGPFNFSSFVVETRSSTSPTATLSDFIVGHVSTAPDVAVTKVADATTVDAGSQVGFTVTVANVGVGDLAGVTLTDALPAGTNNDILWSIAPGGNPSGDFVLNGTTPGSQSLSLVPNLALLNDSAPISVHIVGTTSASDVGTLVNNATVGASNEDPNFSSNNKSSASVTLTSSGLSTVTPQAAVEGASQTFQLGTLTSANSGTANVDVNWGDGTPHTTFTFVNTPNVAFALPSKTHTYGEEGTYLVTESVTLGSTKLGAFTANVSDPNVVAAAVSTITKTYDGLVVGPKALATFTDPGGAEPNASDSGALATHYSATVNWGGSFGSSPATIAFAGTAGSATDPFTVSAQVPYKDVGTYQPVITISHETSTPQSVTATVIINGKTASVTADPKSRIYGEANPSLTASLVGVVSGETLNYTLATTADSSSPVGNYPITVTLGSNPNYVVTANNGTLQVTPRALTITATGQSKTYGDALSLGTTAFVTSPLSPGVGLINSDTVTGVTLSSAGAAATATFVSPGPDYPIVPSAATGSGLANYLIAYANGNLHLNQRPLTITATSQTKPYGQIFTPDGTSQFVTVPSQLVNGNTVGSVTLTSAGFATLAAVATPGTTYPIVPSAAIGSGLQNYVIGYAPGVLTVTLAHLTVTGDNAVFDEGVTPSGLSAHVTGFVNGETLATSGVTGVAGVTTTVTGTSAPGTYPNAIVPTIGTLAAANYDFTSFVGGTLTVNDVAPTIVMSKSTITLSAGDGFTRPGSFTDPGQVVSTETWTVTTDYGDGSPASMSSLATPGAVSLSHTYAAAGSYSVTVTIADNYGASSVRNFTVIVGARDLTP